MLESPDLTNWEFNKMFGLGNKEHNRIIRQYRQLKRKENKESLKIELWNVWEFHKEVDMDEDYENQNHHYKRNYKYEE